MRIGIVGGGSAGLVAALILKTRFPKFDIQIIRSQKIGIIGVGEGSTEHWSSFMEFVGLDPTEVVKECDATFKSGIMFDDWTKEPYLQSIGSGFNRNQDNYPYLYASQIACGEPPKSIVSRHAWDGDVNTWFVGQENKSPVVQYHFNTHKLNNYLTDKCLERGIDIVNDEITEVFTCNGQITALKGVNNNYNHDFYVDCTGFKQLLISDLGATWKSHSKYLKMKSAIVFPTKYDTDVIPMWTRAKALDYGWMFTIPVWDRCGNGYIYDSDYITAEQAQEEVENFLGYKIEVGKQINFDPGALDKCWIGNCCAIGLSASFVEPLEASSIGTSIQQSFLLAEKIINYNQNSIDSYNEIVEEIIINIRDFIVLHYLCGRETSDFWKDIKQLPIPESLSKKLEVWKNNMPRSTDFAYHRWLLFSEFHFTLILHGLGLFNIDAIKYEFDNYVSEDKKQEAFDVVNHDKNLRCETIPHRTMLDILRNIKKENW